jgi:type I restriction enzyme, S subunit
MSKHDLPAGWTWVKFGDVAKQMKDTVDPDTSDLERYVAGGHMDTDHLKIRRWGLVGDGYLGPAFHRKFQKGQILYGSRRTYLRKVAVADFDGICANTTFVIEARPSKIHPPLLPFIMQSEPFVAHSINNSRGSTNPYINWKDIAKYEFALPPLNEQRRIAEVLWALEDTINKWEISLKATRKTLVALRENVICSPKYARYKLESLLGDIVAGKSVVGVNEPAQSGEYGVLKVSSVNGDGFQPEENKRLIHPNDFIPEYSVRQHDLLITRANTKELVGRVSLVERDYTNLMLCDKTLRLDVDEVRISKRYLLEVLHSTELRLQIEARATGTSGSMKNISQNDIRSLLVPLPTIEEQLDIDSRIEYMYEQIRNIQLHLRHMTKLKRSLVSSLQ